MFMLRNSLHEFFQGFLAQTLIDELMSESEGYSTQCEKKITFHKLLIG